MTMFGKTAFGCAFGVAIVLAQECPTQAADDALAWPPITSQTRPWAWWWWHGSAVDETSIAHELKRFHDAGLGGVQITTIYGVKGQETHDIPYLTPAWLEMMGYTVGEAKRLGMGVDMSLGSGWCFGGPTVDGEEANASVVVKKFAPDAGEKLAGTFSRDTTQALVAFSREGKFVDLMSKISDDGAVDWLTPAGSWTVYAISQRSSGQKVKRAAPGGEGWMLNPLYPQAVLDWLKWFDAALANYSGPRPQAVFQDSYEYHTDWAPDFFAQFEKRRSYRLQDELPALFGDARDDQAARVKYDYRQTMSDIMAEQSEPAWIDWAHRNGMTTIYQAHGTPGNWLDLYADADMPETEMFHNDRSILISKFASSAAHTQGRQLTGAETGTWLKEHFTETLADVKYLADDMFLAGVNRIFYHGACYSPDDVPWPGWVFYASTEMNPRNSIWRDVGTVNDYIARIQSFLQSGKSDNDVLVYWPVADFWSNPSGRVLPMTVSVTDWFEGQPLGKTAHELWDRGYAFDYVSDRQLQEATVVDGKIRVPGGDYRVIVVPECKYMPLETFKQMLALTDSGATICFERFQQWDAPGWAAWRQKQAEFQKLYETIRSKIFITDSGAPIRIKMGKGFLILNMPCEAFADAGVVREPMADAGLSFVRRSFDGGWNYFIANRGTNDVDDEVILGNRAKSAVLLDPMTGHSGLALIRQANIDQSFVVSRLTNRVHSIEFKAVFENATYERLRPLDWVRLQLRPGETVILRAFADKNVEGLAWNYWQVGGQPVEIAGRWQVKFIEGGPILPLDCQTSKLASWTTFPDAGAQAFAGTAKYEITFDAPDMAGKDYFLNLGEVCQSARVKLNGKDYGTLVMQPFRVVVDNLKQTGNRLEVEVTNVSANRIRDMDRRGAPWKIFKDANVLDVNYKPFDAADWPLTDSGLIGPVTLTAIRPVMAAVQ